MPRSGLIGLSVVLAVAAVTVGMVLFVNGALEAAPRSKILCMDDGTREKIASGRMSQKAQDTLVSKSLNFDQGVPGNRLWWQVRGAAMQLTYVTFWTREDRNRVFARVASDMRSCPT